MVFKGSDNKAAVIRAATYDLLFNNMKSIVVRTASKYMPPPVVLITSYSSPHNTTTVNQ